jgi:hypothetical protein
MEAEEWIEQRLATARAALRERPLGPQDTPLDVYESRLGGMAHAFLAPTDHYLGLPLAEEQALATQGTDRLCVHRSPTGHRANATSARVHVTLDESDSVVTAKRDAPPWSHS